MKRNRNALMKMGGSAVIGFVAICLLILLFYSCNSGTQNKSQTGSESATPFQYRSISFGTPGREGPPDAMGTKVTGNKFDGIRLDLNRDMVKRAAQLGFNDVTIQTENVTMPKLEALRKWADSTGNFKFIKEQGMTLSVWVHELNDMPADVGLPTLDNEKLWSALRQRYNYICTKLLPEMDYFVLTVVESQLWMTENAEVLTKLVTVINEECRKANKKLIFRTFLWYVKEFDVFKETLKHIPNDVIVMSKCVPQDWHLRGVDDPFIGMAGQRDQYIEFDIAGEYNKLDHVACAFTDILQRQLEYASKNRCDGISVRVDRYGATCWGQAQEANLWFLGYWVSGKSKDTNKAWHDYAVETFGENAAPAMVRALQPTGEVVAEAICVEQESFGYSRDILPALRKPGDPFDVLHSPAKWDTSLVPTYKKIVAGDPEIIRRKTKKFVQTLASANESLRLIDSVKQNLPKGAYEFFHWKLEENRFLLEMFCNMELAWLKDARYRRTDSSDERNILSQEIKEHLKAVKTLYDQETSKTITVDWRGKTHNLRRGSYHNWMGWLKGFQSYSVIAQLSQNGSPKEGINIAFGKPATSSSSKSNHPASYGNDGKQETYWCADDNKTGHWWQVDLKKKYDLAGCQIHWQFGDRIYQYKIEGSPDGKNWSLLTDKDNLEVKQVDQVSFTTRGIQYVKITFKGLGQGNWAGFYEFKVLATE